MTHILRDLTYCWRLLIKKPLFSIVAIGTMALAIGLNTATFSAVHSLLLAPLGGVNEPQELVQLYREWAGIRYGSNSIPHYQQLRDDSSEIFENTAAWFFSPISLDIDGQAERTMGALASANLFETYGVTPELGRAFLPGVEDEGPGAHPVTVLGYTFWQSRFGGDDSVIGRTLSINGQPYEIVGIAPRDFRGPIPGVDIPLWVPLMMQQEIMPGTNLIEARGNNMMNVIARLAPGKTIEQAQAFLDTKLEHWRQEYPDSYDEQLSTVLVAQSEAGIHPAFRDAQVGLSAVMMVVVSLLLLIACVNVANLFLARARERRPEIGMRLSLGAGRWRIVQQLLTESLVVALLAGLLGIGLAAVTTRFLSQVRPPIDGPFAFDIGLDRTVLLFTLVVSVLTGLFFGLAPALQAARRDTIMALRGQSTHRASRSILSRILVASQMALSLVLLVTSGLFLRSLEGATRIDPGFEDPSHLVTAAVDPGLQGYEEPQARAFYDRLLDEVAALPEVTAVGLVNYLPLGFGNSDRGVEIPGYEFAKGERNSLHYAFVTEGYLEALGVPLVEGRTLLRTDNETSQPVLVINRRFAERFWPNESAVGKIVRTAGEERQVIGVVETGKYTRLGEEPLEFMYLPQRERFQFGMTLVARTRTDPLAALGRIQGLVRQMDPQMPVFDVRTMEDHLGIALLPARLGGSALGLFGVLGLVLAAVGLYGVMAYSVSQRQRELGVRVALGANRGLLIRTLLKEGLRLVLIGTGVGLALAFVVGWAVKSLLYTSAFDPATFFVVPVLLVAVAALAVYLPARRASTVDPIRVLKVT